MTDHTTLLHHIPRDEWVKRFKARINEQLALDADDNSAADAELESYPPVDEHPVAGMPNDWEMTGPEDAADECLSNWTD